MSKTISNRFAPRVLDEEQKLSVDNIKANATFMETTLMCEVPEGRYKSLALTALEECVMWATKGVAHGTVR